MKLFSLTTQSEIKIKDFPITSIHCTNYITREDKTNENLIEGKNCIASSSLEKMLAIKKLYNQTDGRQYIHFIV